MAVVSDIEIRLSADIARLRNEMQQARREVNSSLGSINSAIESTQNAFKALGLGAAAVKLVNFVKGTIDAVDALVDLSARVNISVEDLAGLAYGAKLSGTQLEAVGASISKLTLNMGKDGDAFKRLGLSAKEPIENFKDLADIFKNLKDPQQRAAFAAEALGKSWQDSAILLAEGREGIEELMKKGRDLSGVTEQVAKDAAAFNDKIDEIGSIASGAGTRLAAELLPMLSKLTDDLMDAGKGADDLGKSFSPITETFRALVIFGGNVAFTFKAVGTEIGVLVAQVVNYYSAVGSFLKLDFSGGIARLRATFGKGGIGDQATEDAKKAREAFDQWEKGWLTVGTGAAAAKKAVEEETAAAKASREEAEKAAAERAAAFLRDKEMQAAAKKAADEAAAAVKKQADAYKTLIANVQQKIDESAVEAAGLTKVNEAQKLQLALLASEQKFLPGQREAYELKIKQLATNLEVIESNKRAAKAAEDMAKVEADYNAEVKKSLEALTAEADRNEKLAATFGMTKGAIGAVELARLEEQLAQRASAGLTLDEIANLEALIEVKKRSANATAQLDILEANKKATEDSQKLWESIDKTAHDTFVSIANGSKDAATRLKDTFKNVFFDWLYSMTLKKWIVNVSGVMGGTGASGLASAATGALGGGGSGLTGLIQSGKGIYDAMAGGVGASFGTALAGFGNIIGSSAISAFGTGMGLTASQAAQAAAAYNSAGMASTGSALSAGAAVGPYVGAGAGIAGGYFAGRALSGQYGKNSTVNAGTALGTGIGAFIGGPVGAGLGGLVGGIIGGGLNRLFGRGKKTAQEQGIEGMLSGTGFSGSAYAKWTQKGGLFRSNKSGTDRTAVDSATSNAFADSYNAIRSISGALATTLGADASRLAARSQALNLKLTTDAAQNEKVVGDFFQGVANNIASELVPGLSAFQQQGEQLSDTLQRVSAQYSAVDMVLGAIGKTSQEAFGVVGVASLGARQRLIDMAGGLDKLAQGTAYFAQNFMTDAERMAPVLGDVKQRLAALGIAGASTSEDFKQAVLRLASSSTLATNEGAYLYNQLLDLAPQFKQMVDYTEQLAAAERELAGQRRAMEIQIMELSGNTAGALAARRADELAALNASLRPLQERIYALQDEAARLAALKASAQAAYDVLQRSVDAQKTALQTAYTAASAAIKTSIDSAAASLTRLNNLSGALRSTINGMQSPGQESADRASAQAAIQAAVAVARAGGALPELASLQQTLSILAKPAASMFGSFEDYQKDFYRNALALSDLAELSDSAASIEQRTLDALQEQSDILDRSYNDEIERLDKIAQWGRLQIDGLNKVDNSVLSVAAAVSSLSNALGAAGYTPASAPAEMPTASTWSVTGANGETTYNTGVAPMTVAAAPDMTAINDRLEAMDRALFMIARNTGRAADVLSDFDRVGLPETRTEEPA